MCPTSRAVSCREAQLLLESPSVFRVREPYREKVDALDVAFQRVVLDKCLDDLLLSGKDYRQMVLELDFPAECQCKENEILLVEKPDTTDWPRLGLAVSKPMLSAPIDPRPPGSGIVFGKNQRCIEWRCYFRKSEGDKIVVLNTHP
jgi:hypothetical protein